MARDTASDVLATLFPGKTVALGKNAEGATVECTVIPMGVVHFRAFNDAIHKAMASVSVGDVKQAIKVPKLSDGTIDTANVQVDWAALTPVLIPLIVNELLDLLNACVVGIDLLHPRCPQWLLPVVAKAWVEESFGSPEKIHPWIDLLQTVVQKVEEFSEGVSTAEAGTLPTR